MYTAKDLNLSSRNYELLITFKERKAELRKLYFDTFEFTVQQMVLDEIFEMEIDFQTETGVNPDLYIDLNGNWVYNLDSVLAAERRRLFAENDWTDNYQEFLRDNDWW